LTAAYRNNSNDKPMDVSRMNRHWLTTLALCCAAGAAGAEDLQTVYDHARRVDREAARRLFGRRLRQRLQHTPITGRIRKTDKRVGADSRILEMCSEADFAHPLEPLSRLLCKRIADRQCEHKKQHRCASQGNSANATHSVHQSLIDARQPTFVRREVSDRSATNTLRQLRPVDDQRIAISDHGAATALREKYNR
jgi:hypothetical protein